MAFSIAGWWRVKGSLHRKQKISYGISGINPKDLDLLDASSEKEIEYLPLKNEHKRFVGAGVG